MLQQEQRKREEEEKRRKEEDAKARIEREEQEAKARGEAEKARLELEERLRKDEEERILRKKVIQFAIISQFITLHAIWSNAWANISDLHLYLNRLLFISLFV